MLDRDLSALYGVETKMLNRAVKRNTERFPEDFMFQLSKEEYTELLRCQFGTLKRGQHRANICPTLLQKVESTNFLSRGGKISHFHRQRNFIAQSV